MIEFKQNMGKRIYIQRKRMSYSDYGFTKCSEVQSSYQEYSCKPREENEQSYQEYGDPKMSGTDSLFGSAPVNLAAFDDEMERYCEEQRKIKAERLAKRTAYCDEHDIQGGIREKILNGRISIEEFEALQKSASEVTEAAEQSEVKPQPAILTEEFFHPSGEVTEETSDERSERLIKEASSAIAPFLVPEQPAEEYVEVQTDVTTGFTTAETETVPEQPQTGKKKSKKREEVSDAE